MFGDFVLHERLAADTVALADWPLSRVLLMNDASYPWLILVPRRPGLKEFHDMAEADLAQAAVNKAEAVLICLGRDDAAVLAAATTVGPGDAIPTTTTPPTTIAFQPSSPFTKSPAQLVYLPYFVVAMCSPVTRSTVKK